jgi:hypothetical protein
LCNMSSCADLGCVHACFLWRSFTLLLDVIHDHDWSFCFKESWWSNVVWSNNLSLAFATFTCLIFHVSELLLKLHIFSLPDVACLLMFYIF